MVCAQRDKGDNRAKGVGGGVRQEGGENVQSTEEWEGQRERQRGEGEVKDRGREHEEEGERGGGREEEGERGHLMTDGFQQINCVFSEDPTKNQEHLHTVVK